MIHLLTTIYPVRSFDRLQEIRICVERNMHNPLINSIVVFAENVDPTDDGYSFLEHPKVQLVHITKRPTYREFFAHAREHYSEQLVAVCNSDVYFDETLAQASRITSDEMWCLCRYNIMVDGKLELQGRGGDGSADAWIFRAPLKSFEDDITLGVNGCDSYLAQKAAKAGIALYNPCFSVILRHMHHDAERNAEPDGNSYWKAPDYGYYCVKPC